MLLDIPPVCEHTPGHSTGIADLANEIGIRNIGGDPTRWAAPPLDRRWLTFSRILEAVELVPNMNSRSSESVLQAIARDDGCHDR
jgi:hypothetical protein